MATKNDITGDTIATKYNSAAFVNNFDAIFKKKPQLAEDLVESQSTEEPSKEDEHE